KGDTVGHSRYGSTRVSPPNRRAPVPCAASRIPAQPPTFRVDHASVGRHAANRGHLWMTKNRTNGCVAPHLHDRRGEGDGGEEDGCMDDLMGRWRDLAGPGNDALGRDLLRRWREPHRRYHTV